MAQHNYSCLQIIVPHLLTIILKRSKTLRKSVILENKNNFFVVQCVGVSSLGGEVVAPEIFGQQRSFMHNIAIFSRYYLQYLFINVVGYF